MRLVTTRVGVPLVAATAAAIGYRGITGDEEKSGNESGQQLQGGREGQGRSSEAYSRQRGASTSASASQRADGGFFRHPVNSMDSLLVLMSALKNVVWRRELGTSVSGSVGQILAELSSDPRLVDAMLATRGTRSNLVRWLLAQLAAEAEGGGGSDERHSRGAGAAERVLAQMLSQPESARLLLSHQNLFPTLLQYVVDNEFSEIGAALKRASETIVLGAPSDPRIVATVLSALQVSLPSQQTHTQTHSLVPTL